MIYFNEGLVDDEYSACLWDGTSSIDPNGSAQDGEYVVKVLVDNGLKSELYTYTVNLEVAACRLGENSQMISDLNKGKNKINLQDDNQQERPIMSLFPNPSMNQFELEYEMLELLEASLYIYNNFGQKVKVVFENKQLEKGKYAIGVNISDLKEGVYYISLKHNKGIQTERFVILR